MKAGCVKIESLFRFPLLWLLAPALVFGVDDFRTAQLQKSSTLLSTSEASQVDASVGTVMERNGIPAISLAIVRSDQIAYAKAYGKAELPNPEASNRDRLVSTATRFAIGSVSKEFTAAAMLLLADRGKLSLDDPVSRFLPKLTGATQVTIRELLNHTAGYRDYFLQEYIPARMQRATTIDSILKEWAERPLDFLPGTQWQYSGTNYVIAGRIIEEVTGESYEKFLIENVLRPAGITDAIFADHPRQPARNAVGYYRFALGPPRPAPRSGRNWLFAMADLEITATDVAKWDIALMSQHLLSRGAYQAMTSDTRTKDGTRTGYGLGLFVGSVEGNDGKQHLLIHHPGEISGFRSNNFLLPDSGSAVIILTNAEFSDSTNELAQRIQGVVGIRSNAQDESRSTASSKTPTLPPENMAEARAHRLLWDLSEGVVDRNEFAPDALETFTKQSLNDIHQSLAPLGKPQRVRLDSTQLRGGTKHYALTIFYKQRRLQIAEYDREDGRIEQFMIDEQF